MNYKPQLDYSRQNNISIMPSSCQTRYKENNNKLYSFIKIKRLKQQDKSANKKAINKQMKCYMKESRQEKNVKPFSIKKIVSTKQGRSRKINLQTVNTKIHLNKPIEP